MKRFVLVIGVLALAFGLVYWVWLTPGRLNVRTLPTDVTVSLDGEVAGVTAEGGLSPMRAAPCATP